MEARWKARIERADGIVGMRTNPANVKLVALLQYLAQLVGQFIEGQGQPVFSHSRQHGPLKGAVGDLEGGRVDGIAWCVQKSDALPHDVCDEGG